MTNKGNVIIIMFSGMLVTPCVKLMFFNFVHSPATNSVHGCPARGAHHTAVKGILIQYRKNVATRIMQHVQRIREQARVEEQDGGFAGPECGAGEDIVGEQTLFTNA